MLAKLAKHVSQRPLTTLAKLAKITGECSPSWTLVKIRWPKD